MIELLTLAPAVLSALTALPTPFSEKVEAVRLGRMTKETAFREELGVVFDFDESSIGEKCFVSPETAEALARFGWIIEEEIEGGTHQYYYRSSLGTPKIRNAGLAQTNINALLPRIERVQTDVILKNIFITPNPNPASINNTVLGYLRSFNKDYAAGLDQIWEILGEENPSQSYLAQLAVSGALAGAFSITSGSVDPVYTRAQDLVLYDGAWLYCYFSQFVDEAQWSDTYHNAYCGPNSGQGYFFPDPFGGNREIDLIHMFASIDGGYVLTGMDGVPTVSNWGMTFPSLSISRNLTSWAGDLQQVLVASGNQTWGNNDNWETILFPNGASEADLLADIDSFNIVSERLTGVWYLSDAVRGYYQQTLNNLERMYSFIYNLGDSYSGFENEVYSYLGLTKNNGIVSDSTEFTSHDAFMNPKFLILDCAGSGATTEKRKRVAEAFIDYVEGFTLVNPGC